MRIIAGRLGGRQFSSPKNKKTHPMSDKARGAIFNSLGDISGMKILDAFSGSGALSYEAVSRGALSVVAIESDHNAVSAIKMNVQELGLGESIRVVNSKVHSWIEANSEVRFDVILADPPFDNLGKVKIDSLAVGLAMSGVLVLSWLPKESIPVFDGLEQLKVNNYGDSQLVFYRRVS